MLLLYVAYLLFLCVAIHVCGRGGQSGVAVVVVVVVVAKLVVAVVEQSKAEGVCASEARAGVSWCQLVEWYVCRLCCGTAWCARVSSCFLAMY